MPVAVNCSPAPTAILAAAGDTVTETRTEGIGGAGVTVSAAVPEIRALGSLAVIVVTPSTTPVASPVFDTVAVVVNDEDHVTESVRSRVLRSEYVPVAVNCSPAPTATLATGGVTVTETRAAGADGMVGMVVGMVGMVVGMVGMVVGMVGMVVGMVGMVVVGIGKAGVTVRAAIPGNGVAGLEALMVATPVPAPVA